MFSKRSSLPASFVPRELRSQHFPPPGEEQQKPEDLVHPLPARSMDSIPTSSPQMVPWRQSTNGMTTTKRPKVAKKR